MEHAGAAFFENAGRGEVATVGIDAMAGPGVTAADVNGPRTVDAGPYPRGDAFVGGVYAVGIEGDYRRGHSREALDLCALPDGREGDNHERHCGGAEVIVIVAAPDVGKQREGTPEIGGGVAGGEEHPQEGEPYPPARAKVGKEGGALRNAPLLHESQLQPAVEHHDAEEEGAMARFCHQRVEFERGVGVNKSGVEYGEAGDDADLLDYQHDGIGGHKPFENSDDTAGIEAGGGHGTRHHCKPYGAGGGEELGAPAQRGGMEDGGE
mgnify:CR=1 FL=1